ncbi:aminotransferase class V-fold PLP-dependent enzyme [Anaplasmataceae bacterium AB001_6]|nr:aminotransferase class V-fold PLP-dependent enzyme [Anaplasmataceae bacterium AB001_6]
MLISNRLRYAILAVFDIIMNSEQNTIPVKMQAIAKRQNVSIKYLESIMTVMAKTRLLKSSSGVGGGYLIAKDLSELSILDLIQSIENGIKFTRCKDHVGCLDNGAKCFIHDILADLQENMEQILTADYKILDLIQKYQAGSKDNIIYFDSNATIPIDYTIQQKINSKLFYNPSSTHKLGQKSKYLIEQARERILRSIGIESDYKLLFTSSATEANYYIGKIKGISKFFCSAIEHVSILDNLPNVNLIGVDNNGVLNLNTLRSMIDENTCLNEPFLISIAFVNSETGVMQDIKRISDIVHSLGGLLHVDAVQAYSRIDINIKDLGIDLMTISGHKVGAGFGAGALIYRSDISILPTFLGGMQEKGMRSGTENVPAIYALGEIADMLNYRIQSFANLVKLHSTFESDLCELIPDIIICSSEASRIGNTTCTILPNVKNDLQMLHFDMNGICVSNGSACSSGLYKTSHGLKAMGYEDALAQCAIRISSNINNDKNDFEHLVKSWKSMYNSLYQFNYPILN